MYQIPLRFIRVSKNVAICATRIVMMIDASVPGSYGLNLLRAERREGRLIDATAHEKRRTAIILDNGLVIASARTVPEMMRRIEHANTKQSTAKMRSRTKRMMVYPTEDMADGYAVVDEDPIPEIDTDYKDMSSDEGYDPDADLDLEAEEGDADDDSDADDDGEKEDDEGEEIPFCDEPPSEDDVFEI